MSVERNSAPGVLAAAALTRHATIYALGSGVGLVLALVNAAVLTRFLTPDEFGRLGLALVAASLFTIALNAPIAQGAFIRAFGAAEDEAEELPPHGASPEIARRAFGSALVLTGLAGAGVAVVSGSGAMLLVGREQAAVVVVLAASCGALGALWRLLSTILRMERRAAAYVMLATTRPVAVLSISLPLVATGAGITGALAGVALGTGVACGLAGIAVRSRFRLGLDGDELRLMASGSRPFLPVIAGTWMIQNLDLYVVAAFAGAAELGHYRLASRLGALASYGTSAFLSAWGPLELSALFRASDEAHGRQALRGALLFHFLLLCLLLALCIAVAADELVRVAPAEYRGAAELLPWLGLAFVTQGVLVGVYRAASFRTRAATYRKGTFIAGLAYLPLAVGLVILFGAEGAALSAVMVLAALLAAMLIRARSEGDRLGIPVTRLGAATLLAIALYGLSVVAPLPLAMPVIFLLALPWLSPPGTRRSVGSLLRAAARARS